MDDDLLCFLKLAGVIIGGCLLVGAAASIIFFGFLYAMGAI